MVLVAVPAMAATDGIPGGGKNNEITRPDGSTIIAGGGGFNYGSSSGGHGYNVTFSPGGGGYTTVGGIGGHGDVGNGGAGYDCDFTNLPAGDPSGCVGGGSSK
jgi:hypothetical protein